MDFFIADLHNGDENIIQYEHRPFVSTKEMEKVIVENWNKTVTNKDTVHLLGDIGDIEILDKLNGTIIIVTGNHDNKNDLNIAFPSIEVNTHPIMIGYTWLSHEPIGYMPPEIPYLNIHGHLHRFNYGLLGDRTWQSGNRYFCVSVEQINYTPISAEEIKQKLKF